MQARRAGGSAAAWSAADAAGVARQCRTGFLEDLKEVVAHHPGDHELLLAVGGAPARARRRVPGLGVERLPVRAVGLPAAPRRDRVAARALGLHLPGGADPGNAPAAELHECRQCCSFCDRVVHPVRLHRLGLPVPLPLRRRGERAPLHGLHEQGLPRRDRRGAVRAGRAHPARLRRREDERAAAAAVPLDRGARLRRLQRGLRLREPGLLSQARARGRRRGVRPARDL